MAYTKADQKNDARNKQPRTAKAARFNDSQFIQYELDDAQLKELKAVEMTGDDILDAVLEEITNGYKFTIKYDSYSDCFGVFMQDSDGTTGNGGYILTGRGSTPAKALKQVLWKHRTCLDGSWAGYAERRGGAIIDD